LASITWSALLGEEGAHRSVLLSLLVDHGLFYHPDQFAQVKHNLPAYTVGSLRAHVPIECLVNVIETLMSSDAPQAHLHRFTHAVHEVFALNSTLAIQESTLCRLGKSVPVPSGN
jgi:hypothetical protein